MSNATHRKGNDVIKAGIPVGRMITVAALIVALLAAVMLAASLASPAKAGAGAPIPVITTVKSLRPYWDGRVPAFWTGNLEPVCKARYAGRIGIALDTRTATPFAMECEAEGDSGPWSWTVLGTRNGHSLSWHQVRRYCHQAGCVRPSRAILRDLGYGPHVKARMHVAGTSAVFVWTRHGVMVYIS